jgi:predicted ATPase
MRLIVTTHSDILVGALSKTPEAVLICDKQEGGTRIRRPDAEQLTKWLNKEDSLGELWLKGELGGTRW